MTLVYHGELTHRDSAGHTGRIGPGDVQWMTAGSGVVHEEMHSPAFTSRGGRFEVVQLWVNLPGALKEVAPAYQSLSEADIPKVALGDGAGSARVVAGTLHGLSGPARTRTTLGVWDLRLDRGRAIELPVPDGHTTVLAVLEGRIGFGDGRAATEGEAAIFDRTGDGLVVEAGEDSRALLLHGEPIAEPVAAHGPFVMNTQEEVRRAIADYRVGRMGVLT